MRSRPHHNNHGLRQIRRGNTRRQIAAMAARLGVPFTAYGCSPQSNEVTWERPSTGAPPNLRVAP